ncbi:sugar kinase [Altererythrobacter sp. JGD-16]|uniref:Sugar kinase n=2 Tax=Altererythrobacter lutimaris TaxID=2743979 RepID=A0A850H2R8_9SPHN|nr:sugar kinase [Altererythrobacter lutimaris]
MLEFHSHGGQGLRYGGDTLNTAIHLARAGHEVAYITAVGTDPISDALVEAWASEGIDTRFVLRHPNRHPGIYAIHLDEHGERSFLYWRDRSAAKDMYGLPGIDAAMDFASSADLFYFSLITLAVVGNTGRQRLLSAANERKDRRRSVAYDSNFRPSLWVDLVQAREASLAAMKACTIGLPTNSDECELWGEQVSEAEIAERWIQAGCSAAVVKAAEKGCVIAGADVPKPRAMAGSPVQVVDSSGAGDAFNGGFLAGWLSSKSIEDCVEAGQSLARETLTHQGAISFD